VVTGDEGEPDVVAVAVALIEQRGQWLVQRRLAGQHLAGTWEFPGGKVADGETPAAALHREVREELAVAVEVVDALAVVRHDYREHSVLLHPFRCRISEGEPRAVDGQTMRWVTLDQLSTLPIPEANQRLIELVRRRGL
jgi:8-oxo-dGTP diphosphatase